MRPSHRQAVDPALKELAGALLELHRSLIDVAREDYERERGSIASPVDLLHLLVHDPFFQWLRPLSEMVVDLDGLFDGEEPAPDLSAVREEVERFLDPKGEDFLSRYSQHLDRPPLAMAHGRLRLALSALPVPARRQH